METNKKLKKNLIVQIQNAKTEGRIEQNSY